MIGPQELFVTLLAVGLLLLGLEVIVPGGILGVLAGLCLVGALVTGFVAFGPQGGFFAAFAMVVAGGVVLALWVKVFPNTPMGRLLTLRQNEKTWKSSEISPADLLEKEGVAETDLRPGGLAMLDGRRTDVVSDSGYIHRGATVRVVRVEGSRIVVRAITPA